MSSSATPEFAARAASHYDELRASDDFGDFVGRLVRDGDLRGRRLLDIGCGTGKLAGALAERHGCVVWAVDPSPEMLAVAKSKALPNVRFKRAQAEALPFKDGWFERAVMVSVAHHVDRPVAFAEARRVLMDEGRLVISNPDPEEFDRMWLMPYFPELLDRERVRFPTADDLAAEVAAADFEKVYLERVAVESRFDQQTALRKIRGRHLSSFDLLDEGEYEAGLARAERDLPDEVRSTFHSLLVVAIRD